LNPEELTSEQKHAIIVEAAEDKKANYLTSIDLRGKTLIADYFVICSGTSNIHIRAIADGIMEAMEKHGHRREVLEGYGEATWVLLSYGDVVAHIMSETQRTYYGLETLWKQGDTPPKNAETVDPVASFDESEEEILEEDIQEFHDDFGEAEIEEKGSPSSRADADKP